MFKLTKKDNDIVLMSLLKLLKYFTPCSTVSIVNSEQVAAVSGDFLGVPGFLVWGLTAGKFWILQ